MENSPHKSTGFPIAQTVIAVVVVVILAALVWPYSCHSPDRILRPLSNARQIHQAWYRMVLDGAGNGDADLAYPGELAARADHPILTTGQFVEHLVAHQYLDRSFLVKLFSGPDVPDYPGVGPFEGKYSVYRVFKITRKDEDDAIFLATKNFHFGAALDPKAPYGTKGCIVVRKGGDALSLSAGQAMNKNIGVMPGGTLENPGEQAGNTLKD